MQFQIFDAYAVDDLVALSPHLLSPTYLEYELLVKVGC